MLILPSLDQQQLKGIKLHGSSVGLEWITSVPYVQVFGFPSNGKHHANTLRLRNNNK